MFAKLLISLSCLLPVGSEPAAAFQHRGVPEPATSLDGIYENLVSRRELQVTRIRAYALRATFPLNLDFPGKRVPYFVDAQGTHCAVGELLRLDGQSDIVAKIASSNNHVKIGDVKTGPLLDWIASNGLSKAECALIQPSYAQIADYRRSSKWTEEITNLQNHFARVEQTLLLQSERSLGEALILSVTEALRDPDGNPAVSPPALLKALTTSEIPNVRIAAAYALARLDAELVKRSDLIAALDQNLTDELPAVRFWAAVALEQIGSASAAGSVELHRLTLPVLLEMFQTGPKEFREAAIIQLAKLTPESISSSVQLRIVPEVRRTMVQACSDDDKKIQAIARRTLANWRWQRIAFESHRMTRQYLEATHELESHVAETRCLGRETVIELPAIEAILRNKAIFDHQHSTDFIGCLNVNGPIITAVTANNAKQVVEEHFQAQFASALKDENPPTWRIESPVYDADGLYFLVTAWRTDIDYESPKLLYLIPTPAMLQAASKLPSSWFLSPGGSESYAWPASEPRRCHPAPKVQITFGTTTRQDRKMFKKACDIFGHYIAYYGLVLVDRTVEVTPADLIWSGRYAISRDGKPRFFDLGGGGSSRSGSGGWDFCTLKMVCDRKTGKLSLAYEPIEYPVVQRLESVLEPEWRTQELKLMGWRPLEGIDYFGDRLFPPEYSDAANLYRAGDKQEAHQMFYRRWAAEKTPPDYSLFLALLSEEAGDREQTLKYLAQKRARYDPRNLLEYAKFEQSIGLDDLARKDVESAIALWPEFPEAKELKESL